MEMAAAPIPLPDWIKTARLSLSKEDYLKCAITVASELTTFLGLAVAAVESEAGNRTGNHDVSSEVTGVAGIHLEDIRTENVLVIIASCNSFAPERVNMNESHKKSNDTLGTSRLSQRGVCYALGKILFEIFSWDDDLVRKIKDDDGADDDSFCDMINLTLGGDLDLDDDNDESHEPRQKRALVSFANNSSSAVSSKAIFSLKGQGAPLSICMLVSDLLENERGNLCVADTAMSSLDEVQSDLKRMNAFPKRFLYDKTCPKEAMDDTELFNKTDVNRLYGREKEINELMDIAMRVSSNVPLPGVGGQQQKGKLFCEAAFLSGHSGVGKTVITREIVSYCNDWDVIQCKFDRQIPPLPTLLQALDAYFVQLLPQQGQHGGYMPRAPSLQRMFDRISRSIISRVDSESFGQLCQLLPSFRKLFPMSASYLDERAAEAISSVDLMSIASQISSTGIDRNRLRHLVCMVLQAVCSGENPVLICLEDMQWSDAASTDIIGEFILSSDATQGGSSGGLFYLGNYRDNEVDGEGFLMRHINSIKKSRTISVGELSQLDINEMISFKFCLPSRYTKQLAELVYQKTRGNPMFCIEFLKSIVQRSFVAYSVKERRWVYDDVAVEMVQISEGVVDFLTKRLKQLPRNVIEALEVASCFGYQINVSTIQHLGQLWPNMLVALEIAVKEGILDSAGPIFAFSHDMLQESTYCLIPVDKREPLRRKIGEKLAQVEDVEKNAELCTLAIDQINLSKVLDGILSHGEKETFARLNLAAGVHSLHASSYEQARGYFEAGITLIQSMSSHWDTSYDLSLQLFEMATVVGLMDGGDTSNHITQRLNEILAHANSFDDSINARAMRGKLYVSQGMVEEGLDCILEILSHLEEDLPREITNSMVVNEIKATQTTLKDITKETIQNLPAMADGQKKKAMSYMKILSDYCILYSPQLVMLSSCRMISYTFQFGYTEDFIQALFTFAHGVIQYLDDYEFSKEMTRIGQFLMQKSPNEHSIRARMTIMIACVNLFVQPAQAVLDHILSGYHSAITVGKSSDIDNAFANSLIYCIASINISDDLRGSQRTIIKFMHEMTKRKRIGMLNNAISCFNTCTSLIGQEDSGFPEGVEIKPNDELHSIAEKTQNSYLMYYVLLNQMYAMCYFRNHLAVIDLAKKYEATKKGKRVLDFFPTFFEGLSALSLARKTKDIKWRAIGEKAVGSMTQIAKHATWPFENKQLLLQAEQYYLDGRHKMADLSYKAAITSAREHRFIHEEALALELHGIYLVENKETEVGLKQLEIAMDKYKNWGAMKKARDVKNFMSGVGIAK